MKDMQTTEILNEVQHFFNVIICLHFCFLLENILTFNMSSLFAVHHFTRKPRCLYIYVEGVVMVVVVVVVAALLVVVLVVVVDREIDMLLYCLLRLPFPLSFTVSMYCEAY